MNTFIGIGFLSADPEVRDGEKMIAKFRLGIPKEGKDEWNNISCVAFGKTAETVHKYLHKGDRVCVNGSINTGSYTNKDGNKVFTTDVLVNRVEFLTSKGEKKSADTSFMDVPDSDSDSIPFI